MVRAPSHDLLARMADDIRQLADPIRQNRQPHRWHWDHNRNRKPCVCPPEPVNHKPLLDQLRAAVEPHGGGGRSGGRRRVPESRPPLNLDAVDRLSAIYVALAGWHTRLRLPAPPREADWQKAALRQLVGAAPTLAPSIADELADDVHTWWRWAAQQAGWDLEDLR